MTDEERLAAEFETHRPYLHAIAVRTLGSHADADDAVQEAWLRLARSGRGGIADLRGWLTTVTGRICLDVLRRRGVRAEQPLEIRVGTLAGESAPGPENEAVLADSVALALYVVMDALTPAERVSFVLHDVFEVPFDAIAAILGRSTAAAKMLASRARGRVRLSPSDAAGVAGVAGRSVVDAFLAAVGRGDLAGLLAVLAPDVELRVIGAGKTDVVRGARQVAARATFGARTGTIAHPVLVDGAPGVLITMAGRPFTVMAFTIADGAITTIRTLTDMDRLAASLPGSAAEVPVTAHGEREEHGDEEHRPRYRHEDRVAGDP